MSFSCCAAWPQADLWTARNSFAACVGRVGLYNPEGWPNLECIWTLSRGAWGKGYATEGARRAIEYAFTDLDQARVVDLIRPGNTRSICVAEPVGETLQGRAPLFGTETLVYAISREERPSKRYPGPA